MHKASTGAHTNACTHTHTHIKGDYMGITLSFWQCFARMISSELNCWSFCNQLWYDGESSWTIDSEVLFVKFVLLSSMLHLSDLNAQWMFVQIISSEPLKLWQLSLVISMMVYVSSLDMQKDWSAVFKVRAQILRTDALYVCSLSSEPLKSILPNLVCCCIINWKLIVERLGCYLQGQGHTLQLQGLTIGLFYVWT